MNFIVVRLIDACRCLPWSNRCNLETLYPVLSCETQL